MKRIPPGRGSPSGTEPLRHRPTVPGLVAAIRADHELAWAVMCKVADLLGVGPPKTVRRSGSPRSKPGATTRAAAEFKRLKRETAEFWRANARRRRV